MNSFEEHRKYCRILGVTEFSSLEEIKKAYHKKAHENHPDKGGDESAMKTINHAYDQIKLIGVRTQAKTFHEDTYDERPLFKCKTCGKNTHYTLCLECLIRFKTEEKKKRIHRIRSSMFCLNCDKSLYTRRPNTIFCNTKCSKEYYKKEGNSSKVCPRENCLSKEEASRLKKLKLEEIFYYNRKERIAIFTRLIGKKKANWFDITFQNKFSNNN